VLRDVTRQRAEQALRDSEARFRSLAEHVKVVPGRPSARPAVHLRRSPGRRCSATRLRLVSAELLVEHIHPDDHAGPCSPMPRPRVGARLRPRVRFLAPTAEPSGSTTSSTSERREWRCRLQGFLFDLTSQSAGGAVAQRKAGGGGSAGVGIARDFNNLLTAILGCSDLVANACRRRTMAANCSGTSTRRRVGLPTWYGSFWPSGQRQMFRPRVLNLNDVVRQRCRPVQHLVGPTVGVSLPWPSARGAGRR
jgi:hypothetical protein